jgi:hypothetical protein
MNRRDFLLSSVALPSLAAAADKAPTPPASDWAQVRAQFELSADRVHGALFFLATHPSRLLKKSAPA